MGSGKGIFPGRVVWAHDPAATAWDGSTGFWWQDVNTDQAIVEEMLHRSLCSLTGESMPANAWSTAFRLFNQSRGKGNSGYVAGEKIAIKLNMNNTRDSHAQQVNNINASPQLVLALLRSLVYDAGVPASNITIYDASRYVTDNIFNPCRAEFPDVVFVDGHGGNGRIQRVWSEELITYSVDNYCGERVAQCVADAEYLINLALMKAHPIAGVTLCAKNHYGTINGLDHHFIAAQDRGMGGYHPFVDLIGSRELGGKTLLFMVDALYAARHSDSVPVRWAMTPFTNEWPSSLLMSFDPVAIDSVGLDFLNTEMGNQFMPHSDNYLHEAALAGNPPSGTIYAPNGDDIQLTSLGAHEHWDSSSTKRYSRNLDPVNGTGIELIALKAPAQTIDVTLNQPAAEAVYSAHDTITFAASASDTAGSIARVDFYVADLVIGSDSDAADGWTFNWPDAAGGTHRLKARAVSITGRTAYSSETTIYVTRAAENPDYATNGLEYAYYEGDWNKIPNFDVLTAVTSGVTASFDLSLRKRDDKFGFRFDGYVQVPTAGLYTFYTRSDDGSKLHIGNVEVVNNDGLHGAQERSGTLRLGAGLHAITVTFIESGGGQELAVRWEGPGIAKQDIPSNALFRGPVDEDDDGLADAWEIECFGSIEHPDGAPESDWDNDGMSNFCEYRAQTDPKDPASVLVVIPSLCNGETAALLSWPSVSNRSYRIQSDVTLTNGFAHLNASYIPATPPMNCWTTEFSLTSVNFFRLMIND